MAKFKAFLSHYQEMTPLRCTPLEGTVALCVARCVARCVSYRNGEVHVKFALQTTRMVALFAHKLAIWMVRLMAVRSNSIGRLRCSATGRPNRPGSKHYRAYSLIITQYTRKSATLPNSFVNEMTSGPAATRPVNPFHPDVCIGF